MILSVIIGHLMDLSTFCKLQRERLDKFEKTWTKAHEVDPEQYPIEISNDNTGIWQEMLDIFEEDTL